MSIVEGLAEINGTGKRFYHADNMSIYALPADSTEYDRLHKQHLLILHLFGGPISSPETVKLLENKDRKTKVLDLGCGNGSWIKQIAKEYPETADCHACDFVSSFQPQEGLDIKFALGNVLETLPYQDEEFDFVHMRFFTGALKLEEWPIAVKELFRVAKSGGFVQMVEPDGELRAEEASKILEDWNERGMRGSLKKRGGDPLAGLRLGSLLKTAGCSSVETVVRSAPMGKRFEGDELGALMIHDYKALINTLAPVLSKGWDISVSEMSKWGEEIVHECARLKAFHNFVTAVGKKE